MSMTRLIRTITKDAAQKRELTREAFKVFKAHVHKQNFDFTLDEKHEVRELHKKSFRGSYYSFTSNINHDAKSHPTEHEKSNSSTFKR